LLILAALYGWISINSPELTKFLKTVEIDCVGTLHMNTKCDVSESQKKMKKEKHFG
jgi:hypothetical protein